MRKRWNERLAEWEIGGMRKRTGRWRAMSGAVFLASGELFLAVAAVFLTVGVVLFVSCGLAGCGGSSSSESILMVGSTSMETYVSALAEGYMEIHPDVTVTAEFTGSGAGIQAVLGGTADIGISSRNLSSAEKKSGAVENVAALDGIVVCVDSANPVTNLTRQQLIDIYTGAVTNWSQIGGKDSPIVVVGREAGSGTRSAFEEILGIKNKCAYANELDSTGAVMAKVISIPGAIGYVSLDALDAVNECVIALCLDGVAPSAENIRSGTYFLSRPFVMATIGEISGQSKLIQSWFEYVRSEEGQEIAASVGLIPVK